jgi:hypothetical protein
VPNPDTTHIPSPDSDTEPTLIANNTKPIEQPNEPEVAEIVPEEHVIEVVGTNVNVQNDEDSYAIRHVNDDCHYASYKL